MSQPTLGTPLTATSSSVNSITIPNVVITSGQKLAVFLGYSRDGVGITSVVRNGQSLTQQWDKDDTNFCKSACYTHDAPNVGTFDVVISFSGGAGVPNQCGAHAIPITGAFAFAGVTTASSTSGTAPSVGTFALTADDIVLAHIYTDEDAIGVGQLAITGSGVEVSGLSAISGDSCSDVQKIATGGTVTASWSQTSFSSARGGVVIQGAAPLSNYPGNVDRNHFKVGTGMGRSESIS